MRPLLAAIALISLVTSTCTAQSDSAVTKKHYPIKSCRIVFRFFNGADSGTKTVIFDDWGNLQKEDVVTMTDTAMMRKFMESMQQSTAPPETRALLNKIQLTTVRHNLQLILQGQRYLIDLDHHTGAKSPIYILFGGTIEENMNQMGFAFVRIDTLLGKPCKVWEQPGVFRLWTWNNYTVKKQMIQDLPGGMRVDEYATEIDESYSIKPDEFKIPDNIQFQ